MSYNRRLPIYVLLDCSESMVGEAFDAVKAGLAALMADLKTDPMALEMAYVSVIAFASRAQQVVPLTEVMRLVPPALPMGSGTALGAALGLFLQCLDREVVRSSAEQKGDWKPVCFILTDGEPTDDWEPAADAIRTTVVGKRANVIAVALGPDADPSKLRRITETVLVMRNVAPGAFKQFFKWVSASVSTASQRLESAGGLGLSLPHLPEGVTVAAPAETATGGGGDGAGRYAFLHSRCVKTRAFYLQRYQLDPGTGEYKAAGAFPVKDFDLGAPGATGPPATGAATAAAPTIDVTRLSGSSPCPGCGNGTWAQCGPGHVHCCPDVPGEVTLTCPWCDTTATYGQGTFDVGLGRG